MKKCQKYYHFQTFKAIFLKNVKKKQLCHWQLYVLGVSTVN